jgi:hypothetical protein
MLKDWKTGVICLVACVTSLTCCISSPWVLLWLLWICWGQYTVGAPVDFVQVQCPGGSCPPARPLPGPAAPRTSEPAYRWVEFEDRDQVALYDGNRYVGNWSHKWGCFRPIVGNGWGDPCRPPIKPPASVIPPAAVPIFTPGSRDAKLDQAEEQLPAPFLCSAVVDGDELPTGVDRDKLGKGPEFSLCDDKSCRSISRERAMQAIEAGLPDDSHKLRLSIIGTIEDRQRVESALADPANADIRDKVNVWSVDPSHWSVKDAGFFTGGSPSIYLQAPSGKVIGRSDAFEGKSTVDAIRKRVAAYDPKKDPPMAESPFVSSPVQPHHIFTIGGLAIGACLLAIRKGSA